MKNIFRAFSNQSSTISEQSAVDLNEQDLELVNGACHDSCHYDDDDCYDDCDDECCYEHHHHGHHNYHRHHRHHG